MAIIKGTKKILKSDIPNAADWFSPVIGILNEFLDTVIGALRGRLTFYDNFFGEIKEFEFSHGVELEVYTSIQTYGGLLILKTPNSTDTNTAIDSYLVRQIKNNMLGITINFVGAGTTSGKVKFIILG